jgi:cellulose synthase/poly-beta-1,6-N-acetylglucosamine synthase-like glycosyltransferase
MGNTVMFLLEIILTAAALLLLVPVGVLLIQTLFASPQKGRDPVQAGPRPRIAVLMPAHNESSAIAPSIHSVLAQLAAGDQLLVVADNCTDDTAAVAIAAGADVVQRQDTQRRGKGFALDHGVRHLSLDPPDIVVIIDADCELGSDTLTYLAIASQQSGRPVQALDMMRTLPGSGLKARFAEFAWAVKNQVRPLGYMRLGLPCQLMGTGMAFPWALIENAPLATGHIAEDLQLGLVMAGSGTPPLFCPEALVSSNFPSDSAAMADQRTRWEHGHLGVIASLGPRLLLQALKKRNPLLLAMVLDLCVPPLASLALLQVLLLLAGLLFFVLDRSVAPLLLAALATAAFAFSILRAWQGFGRHIVSMGELFSVPFYVLAKLPIYARLLYSRQAEWVRTKRDNTKL